MSSHEFMHLACGGLSPGCEEIWEINEWTGDLWIDCGIGTFVPCYLCYTGAASIHLSFLSCGLWEQVLCPVCTRKYVVGDLASQMWREGA